MTGNALEKTGDAITKAASNPRSSQQRPDLMAPRNLESMPASESLARPNMGRQSPASVGSADSTGMGGFSAADIRAANLTALGRTLDKPHEVLRILRRVGAGGASIMAEAV